MAHQLVHNNVVAGGVFREMFKWEVPTPILQLKVRRTALLEDTFRQLNNADHDNFKKALVVRRKLCQKHLILAKNIQNEKVLSQHS